MRIRQLFVNQLLVSALVTICAVYQSNRASAQVGLSFNVNIQSPSDFYGPLAQYGAWVNVPQYGLCWRPTEVPPDWRPYTIGHWEWTDAGWYWMSDEPWAWACYHYGQWVLDPVYGWVWLPGTQWAPAWVTWREAPDYIGWAPCGPSGVVLAATPFCFVDIHRFHDRLRPHEFVFNDPRILRRSRVVGGFHTEARDWGGARRRIVINKGPEVAPIERATGSRFVRRPVREVARQTPPASVGRTSGTFTQQPASPTHHRTGAANEHDNTSRIYREPQTPQPAPTGREEPRLYHQAPATPQSPGQVLAPTETPRPHEQVPPEERTTAPPQQPTHTAPTTPPTRQWEPAVPRTRGPDREPQTQPAPTGREEPRLYHQAPATPATHPSTATPQTQREVVAPTETPRQHQQIPREERTTAPPQQPTYTAPTTPTRQSQPAVPGTRAPDLTPNHTPSPLATVERAQPPAQVPRRPEQSRPTAEPVAPQPQAPRTVPAPPITAPPATAPAPREEGRRRDHDGP